MISLAGEALIRAREIDCRVSTLVTSLLPFLCSLQAFLVFFALTIYPFVARFLCPIPTFVVPFFVCFMYSHFGFRSCSIIFPTNHRIEARSFRSECITFMQHGYL
jgi:hypothetical protein